MLSDFCVFGTKEDKQRMAVKNQCQIDDSCKDIFLYAGQGIHFYKRILKFCKSVSLNLFPTLIIY